MGHWAYTYNSANQLTAWEKWDESNGSLQKSATLSYDDAGNRTGQTVDHISTSASDEVTSYIWDAQDRLLSVIMPDGSQHAYEYDYRTRRIGTSSTTTGATPTTKQTAIVFSGGLSVAEWESETGSLPVPPTVEYTRGPDMGGGVGGLLYSLRRESSGSGSSPSNLSPTLHYTLSNGRSDIVAQSNQSAALTWTASYEAYGKRTKETGTNQDKQRGNSKDGVPTGLLNEGLRYRDLETGVWLSRDLAGFVDGPDLYVYVVQKPWTALDPDGLKTKQDYRNDMRTTDRELAAEYKALGKNATDRQKFGAYNRYLSKMRVARQGKEDIEKTARSMEHYNRSQSLSFSAGDEEQLDDADPFYKSFNRTVGMAQFLSGSVAADHATHGEYGRAALSFGLDVGLTIIRGRLVKVPAANRLPQGLTGAQFNESAALLRGGAGHIGGDMVVQGSRASETAHAASDIDFAVRVSPEQFNQLIVKRFGLPNSVQRKAALCFMPPTQVKSKLERPVLLP